MTKLPRILAQKIICSFQRGVTCKNICSASIHILDKQVGFNRSTVAGCSAIEWLATRPFPDRSLGPKHELGTKPDGG
jgi:hypothetical protein